MSTSENLPPKKKKLKKWQWAVLIFFVFPIIFSLFAGSSTTTTPEVESTSPEVSTPEKPDADYSTIRACRKWYEVIDEGRKGVQTTEEMRAGFKKVYEAAEFSEIPQIRDAATRMLSSITIYNIEEFESANNDFGNACKAAGQ